ncbi:DUF4244 domain-containing protein [Caenorhabditis elegans]|uniref:DUF4244 domain-containing protein n=1 Tax=Caenorhabditis elegans TaxID=6239 RepID=A8WHN6_CAEEL|nr:DUF4244 domain-containing protein [Caenorhabditis elegans]CAP19624.1 DUF4244 domain-containing protein [Caenorhabditis elegans]|eukprot:NP_001122971.1 Uncharacterized protein CELE_K07C5.13 [Caenorhabditis elegans]
MENKVRNGRITCGLAAETMIMTLFGV